MESAVITVDNVSMMFNLSTERVDNIKEYVVRLVRGDLMFREFWALRNLSFQVKKGRSLGVIGLNGSGKSTLLRLFQACLNRQAGLYAPMAVLRRLLSWALVLIQICPPVKIFFSTAQS